jgi:hypothetical protein
MGRQMFEQESQLYVERGIFSQVVVIQDEHDVTVKLRRTEDQL